MYKFKRCFSLPHVEVAKDGKQHISAPRPYDSFEDCGYEFNEFGHIRSDFSTLVQSQSLLVMQQAAQRLSELRAIEPDNSNLSFDEIIAKVRPRWCQTPKQIMEFEDYLLRENIAGLEDIKADIERKRQEDEIDSATAQAQQSSVAAE